VHIALVALVVISVAIAINASALNAISQSETESRRNDLTHGSVAKFHYGIHVTMPKGKKEFPPELVPVD
jgi:hypothetical protein